MIQASITPDGLLATENNTTRYTNIKMEFGNFGIFRNF